MPVTQEEVLTALKDCHDPEFRSILLTWGWSTALPWGPQPPTLRRKM